MTKVKVLKEGGISGRKRAVGDVVDVKSTLAPILEKDGRVEIIDENKPSGAKTRAASTRGARRRGAA